MIARSSPLPTFDDLSNWARYDPENGKFYRIHDAGRWYKAGMEITGTVGSRGYQMLGYMGRPLLAHRVAWLLMTTEWPSHHIDHINRVRTDNRWSNLRAATVSQNCKNNGRPTGKLARGVIRNKGRGKPFMARVWYQQRNIYIGVFDTVEEASAAYERRSRELFGEYCPD